jgi:hypothetical protein
VADIRQIRTFRLLHCDFVKLGIYKAHKEDRVAAFPTDMPPGRKFPMEKATCFGVHYDRDHDALISHGEPSICRFSVEGAIFWSAGGADIFTEGFSLLPDIASEAVARRWVRTTARAGRARSALAG